MTGSEILEQVLAERGLCADTAGVLCDWFLDNPGARPDLCLLARAIAGTPPEHQDGLPLDALVRVLEAANMANHARVAEITTQTAMETRLLGDAPFLRLLKRRVLGLPLFRECVFAVEKRFAEQVWEDVGLKRILAGAGFTPNLHGHHYGWADATILPGAARIVLDDFHDGRLSRRRPRLRQRLSAAQLVWPEFQSE